MTNVQNRRSSARVDAKIQVAFRSGGEFVDCYSQNLSKGGIYLETQTLPDPNAVLELVLNLPAPASRQLSLQGKIVRLMSVSESSKTIHKVAIQFLEVPPEVQLQLNLLYEDLASKSGQPA